MKVPMFLLALPALLLGACATRQTPRIAYDDTSHPLRETAVLVANSHQVGEKPPGTNTDLLLVDGKSYYGSDGHPFWVRVLPGTHTFTLRISSNFAWIYRGVSYMYVDLPLTIPDMKATHTYTVRYHKQSNGFAVSYEDMGSNSSYGIRLCGMYGDCKSTYTPKFE